MPVFQRTVAQGITRETETVITAPRSRRQLAQQKKGIRAFVEQQNRLNTFDGRVEHVEQHCQRVWSKHLTERRKGEDQTAPDLGSHAWYAQRILIAIAAARSAMAEGKMSLAMSEAVEVGAWATEAQAKFGPWSDVLLGEARTRKNRELSRRGAASVRQKADARDRDILREASGYRRRFPDVTTEHSTRNMAKHIAKALEIKEGTVRDRLRMHKKR